MNPWIEENERRREKIVRRLTAKNPFKAVPLWFSITTITLGVINLVIMTLIMLSEPKYFMILPALAGVPLVVFIGCKIADRLEPERAAIYAWMLGWGAASATAIAIVVNTVFSLFAGDVIGAIIGAPIVEETAKLAAVAAAAYFVRAVDGALDGAILGAMVGAGFTISEDLLYVVQTENGEGLQTGVQRLLLGSFLHVLTAAIAGAFLGAAANKKKGGAWLIVGGLVIAMAIHATWNFTAIVLPEQSSITLAALVDLSFVSLMVVLAVRQGVIVRRGAGELVQNGYLYYEEGHFAGNLKERKRLLRENPGRKNPTCDWFAASARVSARKGTGGRVSVYDDYQLQQARENLGIPEKRN